jgi:hypothetical protein
MESEERNLMPLYEEARTVIETAPFKNKITMTHVEREKNAEADALANFAVDVGRERGAGVNVAEGFLFQSETKEEGTVVVAAVASMTVRRTYLVRTFRLGSARRTRAEPDSSPRRLGVSRRRASRASRGP